MDRPSGIRSAEAGDQEGQLPAKDALPCYMCAINNLENCTHSDTTSGDVNSNAVSMNNTPAPVHHGGRDIPPSYSVTCPELVLPDHATFTIDPLVTTQDSEVPARNNAIRGKCCENLMLTLTLILIFVIAFWVKFFRWKIDGLDRRCTSGCSCQVSEDLVSMDRPREMRSAEAEDRRGPLPTKDGLPCYMCAINNLDNCTHLDAVSRDLNSNAVSMNNTPAPIHHGGRDVPPSYAATCPELVPPGHVAVAIGDSQAATQNSEVLDSSEETDRRRGKNVMITSLTIFLVFVFMWIFWKSR